jgi:hypothetical protein
MEFKTTTGGTTTLVLDPSEEAWLREAARARGENYEIAFAKFELLRRANPLAEFDELAHAFGDGLMRNGAAPVAEETQEPGPDCLEDLIDLDATIRRALKSASSIQVEAVLLQARATTLQAIALIQTLRELDD